MKRLLRGRLGRSLVVFAVSFPCLLLAAVAAGFSGLHFALLMAGCGAAADGVFAGLRSGKPGQMEHFGWSVAFTLAAGAALLGGALLFRQVTQGLSE